MIGAVVFPIPFILLQPALNADTSARGTVLSFLRQPAELADEAVASEAVESLLLQNG